MLTIFGGNSIHPTLPPCPLANCTYFGSRHNRRRGLPSPPSLSRGTKTGRTNISECDSLTIHQGAGFNLIYNIICRGVHSVFRGMYVPFVYNTEVLDIVVSHLLFIIIKSYVHVISIYMFPVSYHGYLCYSATLLLSLYYYILSVC